MLSIMFVYALLTPFPLTVQWFFLLPPLTESSLDFNLIENLRDDPNVAESN